VAGPGSGKSFLFIERIAYWLDLYEGASVGVSSFVRKLVADLQIEISARMSKIDQARVTVATLHSIARGVVERGRGTVDYPMAPHVKVVAPNWSDMVWADVLEFYPELGSGHTLRAFERQFYTEEFVPENGWPERLATYCELRRFYNAVGFPDMITLAREATEANPSLNQNQLWIIDEFQDFNRAEEHLIRVFTEGSFGVLVAGDDEQALYQQLKASSPEIINSYYAGTDFANAMLPYCSRCSYYVCAAASAFIRDNREDGAIRKIYLPLTDDLSATKVQVVATAAPSSAVDYIEKFVASHHVGLDEHKAEMEAHRETDPFLLILTPQKSNRFLGPQNIQRLRELISEWAAVKLVRSRDYWKIGDYCTAAWEKTDNFALRKVLQHEGVPYDVVHELLVEALGTGCSLAEVTSELVRDALEKAAPVSMLIESEDLGWVEKVAEVGKVIRIENRAQVARELEEAPIGRLRAVADGEGDEAIETAGIASPVDMLTLVGAKGLSAKHVIVMGCDDVNMNHTSALTFFVALTRARESLHLITSLKAGGGRTCHRFVLQLPEECCDFLVHKRTGPDEILSGRAAFGAKLEQWTRFRGAR
jgi:superfamily I DNA/RNA helicase